MGTIGGAILALIMIAIIATLNPFIFALICIIGAIGLIIYFLPILVPLLDIFDGIINWIFGG